MLIHPHTYVDKDLHYKQTFYFSTQLGVSCLIRMSEIDFRQLATEHHFERPESIEFAQWLDAQDSLASVRNQFHKPDAQYIEDTTDVHFEKNEPNGTMPSIIYLCGHSLGLPPSCVQNDLICGLNQWARLGVLAYMYGPMPASKSDSCILDQFASEIVGAQPDEVALTNNLSVNMHLLLAAFYRPNGVKNCILLEADAFPTDYYVVESQVAWHGLSPNDCIIQIRPREGEWCLRTEDIIAEIRENASRLALIWLPGVQYLTGQLLNMADITRAGHELAQCPVGWDLAHAIGNVPLELHAWDVDLAVWCSYKYLNAGPGSVGGLFVHQRHHHQPGTHGPRPGSISVSQTGPKLTGWWSHQAETRFDMTNQMELAPGAAAYRVSNPPWLSMISLRTSLNIFYQCGGMKMVREKSIRLTGYLDYLLRSSEYALPGDSCRIITPSSPSERGAQITIWFKQDVERYFRELTRRGCICDMRRPNCIRVSPSPLYTSFVDVRNFAQCMHSIVRTLEVRDH